MTLLAKLRQEIQHLRGDGDVERGNRLVANDELGARRESARDRDPLALSARQLRRKAAGDVGGQTDFRQQRTYPFLEIAAAREALDGERLGDLRAARHTGVERSLGILEHDLDVAAAPRELPAGESQPVLTLEEDVPSGRLFQPDYEAASRALSASGLPDETKSLASLDVERDAVDCGKGGAAPENSGRERVALGQIPGRKKRRGRLAAHERSRGS